MAETADAAHIIFPGDAPPAPQTAPYSDAPATRLNVEPGQSGDARKDDASTPAGKPADDPAATLFKNDVAQFDAKIVTEIFDGFANRAASDGDGGERAREVMAARDGLIADAKKHGTDATELADVMTIIKEKQGDGMIEPTPEQAQARMGEALTAIRAEGITDGDLALACRLIDSIELVSPGTKATLNRSGAGNDPRVIRAAIREAKRRYR